MAMMATSLCAKLCFSPILGVNDFSPISQCRDSRKFICMILDTKGIGSWRTINSYTSGLLFPHRYHRHSIGFTSAVGSGLEASITDPKKNDISLTEVNIIIESQDECQIQLRVDVTGEETQKVFDNVLTNLARTAPPVPGFRRKKGGKTSNVPKSFLLQILGQDRVMKFVIQEIVSTTMADYVKKEDLKVKKKCNTRQTIEELESAFSPGNDFGFNVTLEIEKSDTDKL